MEKQGEAGLRKKPTVSSDSYIKKSDIPGISSVCEPLYFLMLLLLVFVLIVLSAHSKCPEYSTETVTCVLLFLRAVPYIYTSKHPVTCVTLSLTVWLYKASKEN